MIFHLLRTLQNQVRNNFIVIRVFLNKVKVIIHLKIIRVIKQRKPSKLSMVKTLVRSVDIWRRHSNYLSSRYLFMIHLVYTLKFSKQKKMIIKYH